MTNKCDFENPEISNSQLSASELQKILSLQSQILEDAVVSDDHGRLLDDLCILAESFTPNAVASVMLIDRATDTLHVESGPSLSREAIEAFNGLRNGDGSCGNAVFHSEAMYVCNTLEDSRWQNIRDVAEKFNIYSCFSFPIMNRENQSIGSFAISSFEFRRPEGFHRALLETCTSICSVILQRRVDHEMRNAAFEEKLKAKKLSSLGILAGGIAHDFNNLLGAILGNVDLAAMQVNDSKAKQSLNWAMKAIDRASDLTQQLLTFSRGGAPIKKPNDLAAIIRESIAFALHGSNVGYEFESCGAQQPCIVDVDGGQFGQLIQNLAINSRQAMPDGGMIKIDCHVVSICDDSQLKDGTYFRIRFSDNGPGIPKEVQEQIFDPYFTTRDSGTGLGLALCYSIVKNHNGCITVDSSPPCGTCFTVYLPYQEGLQLEEGGTAPELSHSCSGRVIIMDDEEMIRQTVKQMMETLGFDVLQARNGTEVLELLAQADRQNNPIDLTIVDLTIPGGMGGIETKDRILELDPNAKVVVSSGYSASQVLSDHSAHGFSGAVAKPYRLGDLKRVVAEVMA